MKKSHVSIIFISLFLILFHTGCFLNTRKNIASLPDKKFYFSEFKYIYAGQSKDDALSFFMKFPVKKLMFLIASEYNITIDISEYSQFINSKDKSKIKADGSFRVMSNMWEKSNIDNNRIIIIFEQDYLDPTIKKINITIYNGRSILKAYNTDTLSTNSIVDRITSILASGKDNLKIYNDKNYENVYPVPGIIDSSNNIKEAEEPSDLIKIKTMIDTYVKTLDQKQKDNFKHEIIDFIYQKCN